MVAKTYPKLPQIQKLQENNIESESLHKTTQKSQIMHIRSFLLDNRINIQIILPMHNKANNHNEISCQCIWSQNYKPLKDILANKQRRRELIWVSWLEEIPRMKPIYLWWKHWKKSGIWVNELETLALASPHLQKKKRNLRGFEFLGEDFGKER